MAKEGTNSGDQPATNDADVTIPPRPRILSPSDDHTIPLQSDSLVQHRQSSSDADPASAPLYADSDATIPPKVQSAFDSADANNPATMGMSAEETQSLAGPQKMFGSYLLESEIARGGMGVVYKARQVKLKRTVALKMIVAGELATDAAVERFHIEAEAAAQLDHPGIVPIFEVGAIGGQHFFSMGFVEGGSLAGKLLNGPLAPRDAATFVRKIADAVAYAHQKGVVHRDLKPANILIDKPGEPKITDFGLAKHTRDGEAGSGATASGEILGTPSYMPPEQAAGRTTEIGPISDVYSLGAILYALVTGRPPFQAASVMDTLIQVLERDPVPPRQLNPMLPRDLETICLKCLQKEPSRRYQSALELREELDRYLANEPIRARPVSRTERMIRWCKRKPALASLIAAMIVLAIGSFTAIFSEWRRAERNYQRAQELRGVAEERLRETQTIVDKYFTEVSENVLLNKPGMFPLRHQLFSRALEYYQKFVDQEKDNPKLQLEMANAFLRLGGVNEKLVRTDIKSEDLYHKAIAIFEAHLKTNPTDTKTMFRLSMAQNALSAIFARQGDYQKALDTMTTALRRAEQASESNSQDVNILSHQAAIMANMGNVLRGLGRDGDALQRYKKAAAIREDLVKQEIDAATKDKLLAQLASSYMNMAMLLPTLAETKEMMLKAVKIQRKLCEAAPEDTERAITLSHILYNTGVLYNEMREFESAIKSVEDGNAVLRQLLRDHPTVPEYRSNLVRNNTQIYYIRISQNDKVRAAKAMSDAIEGAEELVQMQPTAASHKTSTGFRHRMLGELLLEFGKDAEALKQFERALQLNSEGIAILPDHDDGYRTRILTTQRLSEYWEKKEDSVKAAHYLQEGIEAVRRFTQLKRLELAHADTNIVDIDRFCEFLKVRGHKRDAYELLICSADFYEKHGRTLKNANVVAQAARWRLAAANFDAAKDASLAKTVKDQKQTHVDKAAACLVFAFECGFKELDSFLKLPDAAVLRERPELKALASGKK